MKRQRARQRRGRITLLTLAVLAGGATLRAQAPDFSGTWALQSEKSAVTATAPIVGLIAAGAPKTLHIVQPANGTLVIESQINEGHVRIYKPGGETSTPAGQGGAVSMRARWEGQSLVSEGALKAPNGDTTTLKEVIALSPDRQTLTIEVTATGAEKTTSRMVYTKITDVGGCESWPTPCKRPSP